MRHIVPTALALGLALLPALAQANPDAGNATADGRYVAPNGPPPDPTAVLVGQPTNEAQARGLLAARGYTAIAGLSQSRDGTWHGRAVRNGASVEVGIDRAGRILAH